MSFLNLDDKKTQKISMKKKLHIVCIFLVAITLLQTIYRTFNLDLEYFNLGDSILNMYTMILLLIINVYYALSFKKRAISLIVTSIILLITLLTHRLIFSHIFEWSFLMILVWLAVIYSLFWGLSDFKKQGRVDEADKNDENNLFERPLILVFTVILALVVSFLSTLYIFVWS